jgi:ABC-type sugar transport system ATPase subunit
MSDRVYVMHEGKVVKELQRDQADQETVLKYAMGGLNNEKVSGKGRLNS